MISKWLMLALRYGRRLWVRVALFAVLALIAPALAPLIARYLPDALVERFHQNAVLPILNILASGMLAVTTFSLNVMVTAYRAAASQVTPRSYRVLLEDTTTQNVLATFVGAFIYSLTAIILFRADLYTRAASVAAFFVTVAVVVLVIYAMIRWINHLSDLGSMDNTLDMIERRSNTALHRMSVTPRLGGLPVDKSADMSEAALPVRAPRSGYLDFIDIPRLQSRMAARGAVAHVIRAPGTFVLEGQELARISGLGTEVADDLTGIFTIGEARTFDQDPQYGLQVLAESASRALSPGINDPGTAIDVIGRLERLLWENVRPDMAESTPRHDRVHVARITPAMLIEAAFAPLARDGAGVIELVERQLSALDHLAGHPDGDLARAARDMATYTRDHADAALVLEADKARL